MQVYCVVLEVEDSGGKMPVATDEQQSIEACGIRDVWASNLESEFVFIREVVKNHKFVAMVSVITSMLCVHVRGCKYL